MQVEIGAEAALFPEKEYINGIAVAVQKGIHKWDRIFYRESKGKVSFCPLPTIALILVMIVAEERKVSKSTVSKRTDVCTACKFTVSTTEYTVCQAFCPVVRKRVGSPLWVQGGRHTRLRVSGWVDTVYDQKTDDISLLQNVTVMREKCKNNIIGSFLQS
jgi:hypothetical protein